MSLPPGFLEELRARVPISRVVGRKVLWDARKSNAAKGDFWAPCPFHEEKSPSFHVDDRKGFYYCFGCHAKGDAVSFLREAEGMGFMEAVEALAAEAGMTMPARDPQAAQKADRRSRLVEVMEAANRFFRMQLSSGGAGAARDYLDRRGLSAAARDRFEIGYAPDARAALLTHLRAAGVEMALIEAAGLAVQRETGSAYDRFRGRITFPIRDTRGRLVAFGARAVAAGQEPKYLNSPETELFDKGRSLYNVGPAREAVAKGAPLIVAEGYMDVIALVQAGFTGAVAPLGTAITEEQLRMLWQIAPEPVIALDGDAAGLRAGLRLTDLALPLVEAGFGLRFALLPGGQDPDDLLRASGPAAMRRLIDGAVPMVRLVWQRATEGKVLDSPERRAALDKELRAVIGRIRDPGLRGHYAEEIRRLRDEIFGTARTQARPGRSGWNGPRRPATPAAPLPATRSSLLAAASDDLVEERLREALILAILITHPGLLPRFETELEVLDCLDGDHARLRDALLAGADGSVPGATLRERLASEAGAALEKLFSLSHVHVAPPVRRPEDTELALACLTEELAKLSARRAIRREVEEAMQDIIGRADESLTWRLSQAAAAGHRAVRSRIDDASDLGEDRTALSARLQGLIDTEIWVRKKR
jgi:DNA primase